MDAANIKEEVREFFDRSTYWQTILYDDLSHPFNRLLVRLKDHAFRLIDEHVHLPRGVALDIGCGPGAYVGELMNRGFATYAADISQGMLDACRARLQCGDAYFR